MHYFTVHDYDEIPDSEPESPPGLLPVLIHLPWGALT